MRKVAHILLSLLVLVSTIGVSVSKHYCMGKLREVSINRVSDTCGDMPMPVGMDCCNDQTKYYSLDDDFQPVQFTVDIDPPSIDNLFIAFVLIPEIEEHDQIHRKITDSEYPPPRTDIYIQVESFLL